MLLGLIPRHPSCECVNGVTVRFSWLLLAPFYYYSLLPYLFTIAIVLYYHINSLILFQGQMFCLFFEHTVSTRNLDQ